MNKARTKKTRTAHSKNLRNNTSIEIPDSVILDAIEIEAYSTKIVNGEITNEENDPILNDPRLTAEGILKSLEDRHKTRKQKKS